MSDINIDQAKKELRAKYRGLRDSIDPGQKSRWDSEILSRITGLEEYRDCKTLLCYVPLGGEIDTVPLLDDAWANGKSVAVPYCVPGTRNLEFYRINSLQELCKGNFGVMEPDPSQSEKVVDFLQALLIAPGLAFDSDGYRLGYGGGYYDRFLGGPYAGLPVVGACYSICFAEGLPRDDYDRPCSLVIRNIVG